MIRTRGGRPLALLALGILLAATLPRHTELNSATPAADAVVEEPVREIVLTFTTSVNAALSRIVVVGPSGDTLTAGAVQHPEGREDQIRASTISSLSSGLHRVEWRALSPDGHVVEGTYTFAVNLPDQDDVFEPPDVPLPSGSEASSSGSEASSSGSDASSGGIPDAGAVQSPPPSSQSRAVRTSAGAWIRWAQLVGTILLLGVVGTRFAVLPTTGLRIAQPESRVKMLRGFSRFGWLAVALLLAALPLRLADQLAALGDGVGVGEALVLLFETGWGAGWLLHLGAVTLAVLGLALTSPHGRRDRGWVIVTLAALVLPLVSALQGHAWGHEESRALAVVSLYLHVMGSGLWLGGLLLLVLVGLPALKGADRGDQTEDRTEDADDAARPRPALARLVNGFTRVALPAAVLIVASGAVNAWLALGGIEALVGSAYGRTLLLKLAFVAGAMLLGFYNWRQVRPTLTERPDVGALRIPASVEALLGVVILFVTAVLVATPPP